MRGSTVYAMSRLVTATVIGVLVTGVSLPARANVITVWDEKAIAVTTPLANFGVGTTPYMAQRMMAMVHAAMFDAVNSIERRYRPYLVQLPAEPSTSVEAAAATAAAAVLSTIDPNTAVEIKSLWRPTLPRSPMARASRMASSSARQLQQKLWQPEQTTAVTHAMTIGRRPHLASISRHRSRSLQCGRK